MEAGADDPAKDGPAAVTAIAATTTKTTVRAVEDLKFLRVMKISSDIGLRAVSGHPEDNHWLHIEFPILIERPAPNRSGHRAFRLSLLDCNRSKA
ncbi:hypothetical protein [Nitrobacter sp. JJSN]|uniref:hypothetical protein n=1 Tax=Nitrobacter sp. JJSN TaxID=3453033 RepID=UPI003F766404